MTYEEIVDYVRTKTVWLTSTPKDDSGIAKIIVGKLLHPTEMKMLYARQDISHNVWEAVQKDNILLPWLSATLDGMLGDLHYQLIISQ